jgi:hypothetical protein
MLIAINKSLFGDVVGAAEPLAEPLYANAIPPLAVEAANA